MGAAGGTRATISGVAKVVFPLDAAGGQFGLFGDSLGQLLGEGWEVVEYPVNKCAAGGVGIVANQGEAFCAGGWFVPAEGRGDVLAIAGVFGGN